MMIFLHPVIIFMSQLLLMSQMNNRYTLFKCCFSSDFISHNPEIVVHVVDAGFWFIVVIECACIRYFFLISFSRQVFLFTILSFISFSHPLYFTLLYPLFKLLALLPFHYLSFPIFPDSLQFSLPITILSYPFLFFISFLYDILSLPFFSYLSCFSSVFPSYFDPFLFFFIFFL